MLARRSHRALTIVIFSVALFGQTFDGHAPNKIPKEWLHVRHQPWVDWYITVSPPFLDYQQRVRAEIHAAVAGEEIARRLGDSELDLVALVRNAAGNTFQFERRIDLTKIKANIVGTHFTWTLPAYFVPGDYTIFVVLYDPATQEHSFRTARLRIPQFGHDPLPDAWRDLPAVEFAPVFGRESEPPDRWYLPSLTGRLHLPATAAHPPSIDVVVNVDRSVWETDGHKSLHENLSVLVSQLKVVSQIDPRTASLSFTLLDLARQRVLFEQNDVRVLDWPAMRDALKTDDPNKIDIEELQNTTNMARFFGDQVGRRVSRSTPRVLIILSGPVRLGRAQAVPLVDLPSAPGAHVFYIRYNNPWGRPAVDAPFPGDVVITGSGQGHLELHDQLGPVLKSLSPRVFDVETPAEFRKALAAILGTISTL